MRLFDESNHSATHKLLVMGGLRMKLLGKSAMLLTSYQLWCEVCTMSFRALHRGKLLCAHSLLVINQKLCYQIAQQKENTIYILLIMT